MTRRRPLARLTAALGIAGLALAAILLLPNLPGPRAGEATGHVEPTVKRQARASAFFSFLPRNLLP